MDRAIEINRACPDACRNFHIMESSMRPDALLLRWTAINLDDLDNPVQCFRYECFDRDGTPQLCSVNYADQSEAVEFYWSLNSLYHQTFCTDHTRK